MELKKRKLCHNLSLKEKIPNVYAETEGMKN
jgi:hypothetical protein